MGTIILWPLLRPCTPAPASSSLLGSISVPEFSVARQLNSVSIPVFSVGGTNLKRLAKEVNSSNHPRASLRFSQICVRSAHSGVYGSDTQQDPLSSGLLLTSALQLLFLAIVPSVFPTPTQLSSFLPFFPKPISHRSALIWGWICILTLVKQLIGFTYFILYMCRNYKFVITLVIMFITKNLFMHTQIGIT